VAYWHQQPHIFSRNDSHVTKIGQNGLQQLPPVEDVDQESILEISLCKTV
jgi:hypothetical protein